MTVRSQAKVKIVGREASRVAQIAHDHDQVQKVLRPTILSVTIKMKHLLHEKVCVPRDFQRSEAQFMTKKMKL